MSCACATRSEVVHLEDHHVSPVTASALEVARRCDDIDAEVQCVRGLYNYHFVRGEYHQSDALLDESLRRTQHQGDPFHRACLASVMGSRELYTGQVREGRNWLRRAAETDATDAAMGPTMQVLDVDTAVAMNLSWALWLQGEPREALEKSDSALESAAATQNPFPFAISHIWAGGLAYTMGDRGRLDAIVSGCTLFEIIIAKRAYGS